MGYFPTYELKLKIEDELVTIAPINNTVVYSSKKKRINKASGAFISYSHDNCSSRNNLTVDICPMDSAPGLNKIIITNFDLSTDIPVESQYLFIMGQEHKFYGLLKTHNEKILIENYKPCSEIQME